MRKTYGNITLPEGSYDALTIVLGNGEGENWWCVMYPPLCLFEGGSLKADENAADSLLDSLSDESASIILKEGKEIEYKFKIVELYEKIINLIR